MANRPLKRTVRIVLTSRDAADSLKLLQDVEMVFRPRDLTIVVGESSAPANAPAGCPNEQLETAAREKVAEILDAKDTDLREAATATIEPNKAASVRSRIRTTLARWTSAGWRVLPKLLTHADKLADIAGKIDDIVES